MEPFQGSEIDTDIDWSDAGFYGFLETLADQDAPPRKVCTPPQLIVCIYLQRNLARKNAHLFSVYEVTSFEDIH